MEGIDHLYGLMDTVFQTRMKEIIHEYKIKVVVETGTDNGLSAVELSKMADLVFSVDVDLERIALAHKNIATAGRNNIVLVAGNSPSVLSALKYLLPEETLYFLDAHHWAMSYWPLRDEILAIPSGEGVIVLHDIQVPGHPELGFDTYNGQHFTYEYVKDVLTQWSPTHRIEYNDKAECPMPRGIAYLFPK